MNSALALCGKLDRDSDAATSLLYGQSCQAVRTEPLRRLSPSGPLQCTCNQTPVIVGALLGVEMEQSARLWIARHEAKRVYIVAISHRGSQHGADDGRFSGLGHGSDRRQIARCGNNAPY